MSGFHREVDENSLRNNPVKRSSGGKTQLWGDQQNVVKKEWQCITSCPPVNCKKDAGLRALL
jgi:hypothetical protein